MKLITITLLFLVSSIYSQIIDTFQSKRIFPKEYTILSSVKVLSDSTKLDGYMIFEFLKNPNPGIYYVSPYIYACDIYFTSKLDKYQDSGLYIYNNNRPKYGFYYVFTNEDYKDENTDNYDKFRQVYQKYSLLTSDTVDRLCNLKTDIFVKDNISFYYSYSEDTILTVFKVSFFSALLKYDMFYYDKNLKITGDRKEFLLKNGIILKDRIAILPISKAEYFEPLTDHEMIKLGFKKSSWSPKNLFFSRE